MVTSYFNQELTDVCFETEALDEWKELAESMGLTNQSKFVSSAKSPIPFPYINESTKRILQSLCPTSIEVEKYNKTPIPLEVMRQLKYCKDEGFFNEYAIWYDDKSPDPCLIGITCKYYGYEKINGSDVRIKNEKNQDAYFDSVESMKAYCIANGRIFSGTVYKSTWGDDFRMYLIARWADVVRPLNELRELAKERLMEKYGTELKNTLTDTQNAIQKLNENISLYMAGDISESQLKGNRW